MRYFEINCDVGEGLNNETEIMPFIQSCNIACGGHAGDKRSMQNAVGLAIKNNVKIGAHPSYPDKENFGRKTIVLESKYLQKSILRQVNSLQKIITENKGSLHHIKPHGALYNDIAKDNDLALLFLEAILPFKEGVKLYVPYNSAIEKNAKKYNFSIIYEAFADRNYNDDLSLISRSEKYALITDPNEILQHVLEMVIHEEVTAVSGAKIPIKAQTYCVHSDTKNVIEIIKRLYQERML